MNGTAEANDRAAIQDINKKMRDAESKEYQEETDKRLAMHKEHLNKATEAMNKQLEEFGEAFKEQTDKMVKGMEDDMKWLK